MSPEERQALEHAAARRPDVQLIDTTELESLIWRADLVVSMSGYNTTAEIVAAKKPSILVPRWAPRAEQRLRAQLLSHLGLARMTEPKDELSTQLRELLEGMLAGPSLQTPDWKAVDLGGVHRVGDALSALFRERITPHTYAGFNLEEAVGAE